MRHRAEENRRLTSQMISLQEAERRGLARELHDEMGQDLTALKTDAVLIREQVRNCPEGSVGKPCRSAILQNIDEVIEITERVYDIARNMTRRLRPSGLDDLGLEVTLRACVSAAKLGVHGIESSETYQGDLETLGEELNITVYRILQEALTNVVKHALASRVSVKVWRDAGSGDRPPGDTVHVVVCDDGRGMNADETSAGLGLIGLRERVEALGGSFEVVGSPADGVRLTADIPVQ